jgi:hypothetical protein
MPGFVGWMVVVVLGYFLALLANLLLIAGSFLNKRYNEIISLLHNSSGWQR